MFESDNKKSPEEIVKEKIEEIKLKKETSKAKEQAEIAKEKTGESKVAPTPPQGEKEKDAEKLSEEKKLEAQAKIDEQLLSVSEEDAAKLPEEDKVRRESLQKKQEKSNVQKRIDQLVREREELKEARNVDHQKILELEKEIKAIKNPPKKEDHFVSMESERIKKYVEEDANKPLEEKREMTKDELDEWILEDSSAATEWITNRTVRRLEEKKSDKATYEIEIAVNELLESQKPYIENTIKEHPELNTVSREAELEKEGKNKGEIFNILCKENEKYKVIQQVLTENPKFYTLPNGPELAVKEMEKRMKITRKNSQETQEEREARLKSEAAEAERQRQDEIDEGGSDYSSRPPVAKSKKIQSEVDLVREQIIKRSGLDPDRVKERMKKRGELGLQ